MRERENAHWGEGMRWLEVGGADEERLRAAGVQVEGGVFAGPGGSFLKVRDPDGNAWFLHQPGEEAG